MYFLIFILAIIIIPVIVVQANKSSQKKKRPPSFTYTNYQAPQPQKQPQVNFQPMNNGVYPYRKNNLLTTNERLFYQRSKGRTKSATLTLLIICKLYLSVIGFNL